MRSRVIREWPSMHTYRGLKPSISAAYRLRVLLKYAVVRSATRVTALTALADMENAFPRTPALVIAGGPSSLLLDPLKVMAQQRDGLKVYVVNMFSASDLAKHIRPDFYCLSDPAFFVPSKEWPAAIEKTWNYICETECKAIIPAGRRAPWDSLDVLKFNNVGLEGWSRNINPISPRGYSAMVAFTCIAVALYLGHPVVYIAGVDNNQFRKLYRDTEGRLRYAEGTHHHHTNWSNYVVGDVPAGNLYRGEIAAYFEDVARIFDEARMFPRERVVHVDPHSLFDAFRTLGEDDVDLIRDRADPPREAESDARFPRSFD